MKIIMFLLLIFVFSCGEKQVPGTEEFFLSSKREIIGIKHDPIDSTVTSNVRTGYICPRCHKPIMVSKVGIKTRHFCGYTSWIKSEWNEYANIGLGEEYFYIVIHKTKSSEQP